MSVLTMLMAKASYWLGLLRRLVMLRLGLTVAADVLDIQVQQVVILLQQGLIGCAQEVIRSVVDVQPNVLGRMSGCIQLVGNRRVNLRWNP